MTKMIKWLVAKLLVGSNIRNMVGSKIITRRWTAVCELFKHNTNTETLWS